MSVEELARWRDERREFVLLDVREPFEVELARIDGSLNIPMRQIPARIGELDSSKPIVVLCHHGERSAMVAQFLTGRGFGEVYNVDGGIDAFARHVDATIALY